MHYLIDGHNLIPNVAGLSLADPDDEMKLVHMLNDFCRIRRQRVSVFFDGAPVGMSGASKIGLVEVNWVPRGISADSAIARRLRSMKGAARNVAVVSSDRQVQASASASRATILSAAAFANKMIDALREAPEAGQERSTSLSDEEVAEWMALFRGERHRDDKSLR